MAERGHEYVAASVHSPTTPTTSFSPAAWTGLVAGAGSTEGRGAAGSSETGCSSSARDRTGRSSSSLSTLQPALGSMTFTQAAAAMASNGNGESSSRSGNGRTSAGSTSHTDENGQGSSSGSRSGGVAIPEPVVVAAGPSRSEGALVPTPFPYTYQPRRHGSTSPYESREPTGTGYVQLERGWSGESSRGIVGRSFRSLLGRVRNGRRTSAPPVMEGRRLPALRIQVPGSGPGPGSGLPVVLVEPEEESEGMGEGLLTPGLGIESSTSLRDDFDYSRPFGGVGAHIGFLRIWVLTLTCRQCTIQATVQVDRHSPKGTIMDNNLMDYLLLALLSYIHRNKTTVTLTISVFRYYFECYSSL